MKVGRCQKVLTKWQCSSPFSSVQQVQEFFKNSFSNWLSMWGTSWLIVSVQCIIIINYFYYGIEICLILVHLMKVVLSLLFFMTTRIRVWLNKKLMYMTFFHLPVELSTMTGHFSGNKIMMLEMVNFTGYNYHLKRRNLKL